MKRLFFAIALVAVSCLSMSAYATDSQSDSSSKPEAPERQGWREDFPLYGDVESVVVATYKLEEKFGEVVQGDIVDCEKYYFNKAGDVIERDKYNSYGSLRGKDVYKYDTSGNMIEGAGYNSDGSLLCKEIYKYDTSGNMIEEALYNYDGSLDEKLIYKYDTSGNVIEKSKYYGDALLPISQTVYEITYRK